MNRRIISLVPSLTETLVGMGLRDEIVGITQFCVSPPDLHRSATIIGGTKDVDVEKVNALKPTHVFANREENIREQVEALDAPKLITDTSSVTEVSGLYRDISAFLDCQIPSDKIEILENWYDSISKDKTPPLRCIYLIWRDPYMSAGQDTYISSALSALGFQNEIEKNRYPEWKPHPIDYLWLSSEPYPFRKRDAERLEPLVSSHSQIGFIDGKIMSWYGESTLELARVCQSEDGPIKPSIMKLHRKQSDELA